MDPASVPDSRAPEPPDEALIRAIIGCFFDVYNGLGHGFLESVYAHALAIEFRRRGLDFEREARLVVRYRGAVVGTFRADFLVERRVVVELKATARPHPADRAQLHNSLRAGRHRVGLLLHFGEEPWFWRITVS
jgi:GxxExxY protein